jgi:copper chaperone CopZ
MKKFKTNIKCDACIAKVTPLLNETVGEGKWKVDITVPSKTLTIESDESEEAVNTSLARKGYKAEQIEAEV